MTCSFWTYNELSPLESLTVIKCGVDRGLVGGRGVVGAGCICGPSIGRWNFDKAVIRGQEAVCVDLSLCYLQSGMEFVEQYCTGSIV